MRVCDVTGCGRKHHGAGLCITHYKRVERGNGLRADEPVKRQLGGRQCDAEGCERKAVAWAGDTCLCQAHAWRLAKHGDTFEDVPIQPGAVDHGTFTLAKIRESRRQSQATSAEPPPPGRAGTRI